MMTQAPIGAFWFGLGATSVYLLIASLGPPAHPLIGAASFGAVTVIAFLDVCRRVDLTKRK